MVFLHDYIFRLIFNTYYKNGMERSQKSHIFSPAINRKAPAHRFSLPGHPRGIEVVFSRKRTLFQAAERR